MKRITYILLAFMLTTSFHMFSQSEVEALRFSRGELYGTARSMAMGGAFGALGGDMTGVSINPAGIGVYRSSEVAATFGLQGTNSNVGDIKKSITDFNVHNFGFVGYFPMRNETMPLINFGFSHNRRNNLNKRIGAAGYGVNSMMDYISYESYGVDRESLIMGKDLPDPFLTPNWLTVMGFNSWLIHGEKDSSGNYAYSPTDTRGDKPFQEIITHERGYVDNYDLTVGTTINEVLNIGVSLSLADIYHYMDTEFLEDFVDSSDRVNGGYTLGNNVVSKGSGVGAKLGVIYRPIHELRIGVAYHSPVFYSMSESYDAYLADDMGYYVSDSEYKSGTTSSARFANYYDLRTPSKWVISAASVLGNNFIFSADYELTDYRNMKLSVPGNSSNTFYDYDNDFITQDFKLSSTLRLGAEYRFNQRLSARLGYAWIQNPYNNDFKSDGNSLVAGSKTIYRMEGDSNYFTGGLGYRFTRAFYMDFAMVYQTQKDELYPFPNIYDNSGELVIDGAPFELKNNSVRGVLTLGYKF